MKKTKNHLTTQCQSPLHLCILRDICFAFYLPVTLRIGFFTNVHSMCHKAALFFCKTDFSIAQVWQFLLCPAFATPAGNFSAVLASQLEQRKSGSCQCMLELRFPVSRCLDFAFSVACISPGVRSKAARTRFLIPRRTHLTSTTLSSPPLSSTRALLFAVPKKPCE